MYFLNATFLQRESEIIYLPKIASSFVVVEVRLFSNATWCFGVFAETAGFVPSEAYAVNKTRTFI